MAMRKISAGAVVAIAVTGLFLTLISAGVLTASQSGTSSSTITAVSVGVYNDSGCTQNCTNIDWGTIYPGNSTTRVVYIKNSGNVPVTLDMTTMNWVPTNADTHLMLDWNRANYVLAAGSSVSATLTLTVSTSTGALTSFSFSIVITGMQ